MIRPLVLLGIAVALTAAPGRAEWTGGGTSEVPLDGNGTSWLVHATLNGSVRGVFLLDTGASYCVLAPSTARRLGIPASGEQAQLRTANGLVRAPVVRIRTLDVGGNRARDVPAVVHTAVAPPIDGVIGLSYLNNFTYSVDPRRRILILRSETSSRIGFGNGPVALAATGERRAAAGKSRRDRTYAPEADGNPLPTPRL